MRIYIELLLSSLCLLPTAVFYYNCKRIRRSVALSIALWALPSIFIVAFTHSASKLAVYLQYALYAMVYLGIRNSFSLPISIVFSTL